MKQFTDVNSQYGAPMGRATYHGDSEAPYKFRLFKVRLNSGGYDDGGAYWGTGEPLYCADSEPLYCDESETDYPNVRFFRRAKNRNTARALVLADYPNARFYR